MSPNRNYIKGRAKEYRVMETLRENGFDIVQRSAGSHSPIDIFAIDKTNKTIMLVQCKPDNFSTKEALKIQDDLEWLNDKFIVGFKII